MKMMTEEESGMTILIQFHVGPNSPQEMAVFVELFHASTNRKLGRMAVLFDNAGTQGIHHEQWTWVSGETQSALH